MKKENIQYKNEITNLKNNNLENKKLKQEYINKINYNFKKNPQKLKFKFNIATRNMDLGYNDIFEVYILYKDNCEYIASPNLDNNIEIFNLFYNEKIVTLKGHENNIRTIRYFFNKKYFDEYLISGGNEKVVIIWDINKDFKIKYKINTNYEGAIMSCLLIFPFNNNDNYIITSNLVHPFYKKDNDKSAIKVFSFETGDFIKYINKSNNNVIYFLLEWHNKKDNKYYIIQFSYGKILINNLLEDELYSKLIYEPDSSHPSGFIFNRDNQEYLCSSSLYGFIDIWDLYNKKIKRRIKSNNCCLYHIIEWNNKYFIFADHNSNSFKIIDIEEKKIINIKVEHTGKMISIKKVLHPIYGESLLSSGCDHKIKLWTIN